MERQKHSLRFRQASTLRERFETFERQTLRIEVYDAHDTCVSFFKREETNATEAEAAPKKKRPEIMAQAEGVFTINDRVNGVLSEIENRRLPAETTITDELQRKLDSDGLLKEGVLLPFSALPDYARERFVQIDLYLNELRTKMFELIKWRSNILGEYHRPFFSGSLWCSRDGENWLKFRPDIYGKILLNVIPQITDRAADDIRKLYLHGRSEPLCRQLYREATVQQKEAPRSALVVVVAALEAGLKECIVRLQPEVRWLLEETQSPPLTAMLERYWPNIPGKKQFEGKDIIFHEDIIKHVRNAVTLRNKLVHGWDRPIDWRWLEEFSKLVQDMLWIFDYVTGVDWALEYVKGDTLQKSLR